jgi:hypothetical protein
MARKPQKQPPPEFVQELAEWLGRVLIAASQIEHMLGVTIADMLKINRLHHRSFVIPMSLNNKITLLRQLGREYLNPGDRKTLKALLTEIENCADLRNGLVHGFYGVKKGKFALITHSGDAKFSGLPVEWQPSDLRKLVVRLNAATQTNYQIRHLFPSRLRLPKSRKATPPSPERA